MRKGKKERNSLRALHLELQRRAMHFGLNGLKLFIWYMQILYKEKQWGRPRGLLSRAEIMVQKG